MDGIKPIMASCYATLVLPPTTQLHPFPYEYLKHLPRFNEETGPSVEDHLATFLDFANNMNIEHEDVYTRLFVQSLEGNVRIWFRQLQANSINPCAE